MADELSKAGIAHQPLPKTDTTEQREIETETEKKDRLKCPGTHTAPAGWEPMCTAPHTGKTVDLLNDDYSITRAFWGQSPSLEPCWIRDADRHYYLTGNYRFIGWRDHVR